MKISCYNQKLFGNCFNQRECGKNVPEKEAFRLGPELQIGEQGMGKKKKQEKEKKRKEKDEKLLKDKAEKKAKAKRTDKEKGVPEALQETPKAALEMPEAMQMEKETRHGTQTDAAEIFRVLGDEVRMQILELLEDGELCAADLLKSLSIAQSTLSHHMKKLVEADVVRCRYHGKWSYYSINRETLRKAAACLGKWS